MKHLEETEAVEIEALGIARRSCGKHVQEQNWNNNSAETGLNPISWIPTGCTQVWKLPPEFPLVLFITVLSIDSPW